MFPKRHMRSMGPHGVLHEKHVRLIKQAVQKCFDGMPATAHPHDGDVDKAFIHLIPILKEVFTIPTMSAGVDVLYREHLLKNPLKADFHEMEPDQELLEKWIDEMEAVGTKDGKPRRIHITGQGDTYKMTNLHTRRDVLLPRNKTCHPRLKKFRGVSHTFAIKKLLKLGMVPFIVTQNQLGEKVRSFSNCNRVRYTYYVFYCYAEGLTIMHDEAQYVSYHIQR